MLHKQRDEELKY